MNLLKLFGLQKKEDKPYPYKDILHLWQDDNLMLELLPAENLEFVKRETRRIEGFGKEHFDGSGFTDITVVGEKPFKTIERLIDISEIEKIMSEAGLVKINQFVVQYEGFVEGDRAPLGFGTNTFAIICRKEKELIKDIWIAGHTKTEEDRGKLIAALLLLGQTLNFIAVNWFKSEYYNLVERQSVEEFIKDSC